MNKVPIRLIMEKERRAYIVPKDLLNQLADNDPINWLFGEVLQDFAGRKQHHFLFDILAGKNPHAKEVWNCIIAEFRSALVNPDDAAKKCSSELKNDRSKRVGDFMAEVYAIVHLSRMGYMDFEAVLADNKTAVDFVAKKDGRPVRIEVKHLQQAQDLIRTVATKRWYECVAKDPELFSFGSCVHYHHHGRISAEAISRLSNAIDQLPCVSNDSYEVVLDGGIRVILQRTSRRGARVISAGFDFEDLRYEWEELHNLFLKSFRIVGESLKKFRQHEWSSALNLVAMQWDGSKPMYSPEQSKKSGVHCSRRLRLWDWSWKSLFSRATPNIIFGFVLCQTRNKTQNLWKQLEQARVRTTNRDSLLMNQLLFAPNSSSPY